MEIFLTTETYVFTGFESSFHPDKIEKNAFGHFILGKFLQYKDIPLHGDIIPAGKAIFENGIVDCGKFHNVLNILLAYKKNV